MADRNGRRNASRTLRKPILKPIDGWSVRKMLRTPGNVREMAKVETDWAKILARLRREGWVAEAGSKHDKLGHPGFRGVKIMVPRHKALTQGVARSIAKAAGWIV